MRHSAILNAALACSGGLLAAGAIERQIYDYARERKFPPPETLARKAAELAGGDFPYASLAEAPEAARVYFTVFRAVAEALEPFHEPDPAGETWADLEKQWDAPAESDELIALRAEANALVQVLEQTSCATVPELVQMAQVGSSLLKRSDDLKKVTEVAVSPGNADADEYMRGMANGLILAVATMNGAEPAYIEPPARKEQEMDDTKEPADDVDELEKQRRIAQAETDKVIAESGGKFSEDAPKKKQK